MKNKETEYDRIQRALLVEHSSNVRMGKRTTRDFNYATVEEVQTPDGFFRSSHLYFNEQSLSRLPYDLEILNSIEGRLLGAHRFSEIRAGCYLLSQYEKGKITSQELDSLMKYQNRLEEEIREPTSDLESQLAIMYLNKKMTMKDIGKELKMGISKVWKLLHDYKIPTRSISEATSGKPKNRGHEE